MERIASRGLGAASWLLATAIGVSYPADLVASAPPRHLRDRIAKRDRELAAAIATAAKKDPDILGFAIERSRTWLPGSTVRVAFRGGSARLRADIAGAARTWTQHANVTL